MPPPRLFQIRVSIIGDSVTQGCCGTPMEEIFATPLEKRLTDQTDGSANGLRGWPYLLNSLLINNNKTDKYVMMNYADSGTALFPNFTIKGDGINHSYRENCRW